MSLGRRLTARPPAQVWDNALALNQTVEENLAQLETTYREQTDYVSIVQKLQGQLDELLKLLADVPFWSNTAVSLEELARRTEAFDFYRSPPPPLLWLLTCVRLNFGWIQSFSQMSHFAAGPFYLFIFFHISPVPPF